MVSPPKASLISAAELIPSASSLWDKQITLVFLGFALVFFCSHTEQTLNGPSFKPKKFSDVYFFEKLVSLFFEVVFFLLDLNSHRDTHTKRDLNTAIEKQIL